MLCKFELIELNHTDYLCSCLEELLKVFRALQLHEVCFEDEDTGLTNIFKILLVEVGELLLAQDRLKDVQHTVDHLYHGADLSKGLRSLCLRILLQSCHCKLVQRKNNGQSDLDIINEYSSQRLTH